MKKYAAYFNYFLFWLCYFIVARGLFLAYHHSLTSTLTGGEVFKTFLYGLRMDVAFTAYLCILPFLLFLIKSIFRSFQPGKIIQIYTGVLVIFLSFLTAADLELYHAWGFRMDVTPLQYLSSPKEMGTSISSAPVFLLLIIFLALAFFFLWIYKKNKAAFYFDLNKKKGTALQVGLSFFLLVCLFVPIRGGIQKIPINQSDVYFSQKIFANHAALNLPWNLTHSILNKNSNSNPFHYFNGDTAKKIVDSLYNSGPLRIPVALSTKKPNIIFIILESYTAKFVGALGAEKGVTPNIDRIASEGLLFTNIYAAGDRSEKGQVAILSGYPNQAITSVIKTPTKTQHLPALNRVLEKEGYHSSYTYGGELEFANIKSYLLNAGFQELISKYSFDPAERTTSWGVHDGVVLEKFHKDLNAEPQPFFATVFTLSSHEPYDVPLKHFKGNDETTLFRNAAYYTDSCVGNFFEKIKKEPWWQNTLVVLVADHGHPLPGHDPNDRPSKFHIPLIFTGGALKLKGVVNNIGSQTDIATTVLHQLGLSTHKFIWGKDLLDSSANQFAFYSFNNGFGFVTPKGAVTVDNVSKKIIYKDQRVDSSALKKGKAYMQESYEDFLKR